MTIGALSCAMMRTIKSETNKRNSGNHSDGQGNGGTDEDSGGLAKKQNVTFLKFVFFRQIFTDEDDV